jgi:CAAX prenyl protease-like protein
VIKFVDTFQIAKRVTSRRNQSVTTKSRPWVPYVVPMAIYMAFLLVQLQWPEGLVWLYPLKTVAVGAALLGFRKKYGELRVPRSSAAAVGVGGNALISYTLAVAVGLVVIVVWIGVDPFYPGATKMGGKPSVPFDPTTIESAALRYVFIGFRVFGAVVVVALMEEIFWRGFLIRWLDDKDFKRVPVGTCSWKAFGITVVLFGLEHEQWLAGMVCGALYNWLYCMRKDLFSCVLAHATSNAALAAWILWRGDWKFW